jgi:hypothetical protein
MEQEYEDVIILPYCENVLLCGRHDKHAAFLQGQDVRQQGGILLQ